MTWLHSCEVKVDPAMILYNNFGGKNKILVNMLMIVMKKYISSAKCFQEQLSFRKYIDKLSYWYFIEKTMAIYNGNMKNFDNK